MSTLALDLQGYISDDFSVAQSQEFREGLIGWRNICQEFYSPVSRRSMVIEFYNLVMTWEEETMFLSSVEKICSHPAYLRIIGMGEKAVPFIIRELEKKPAHWFWALCSITGENPVRPEQRGNLREMSNAWIEWAEKKGYC